jgi:hypothetical protein
VTIDKSFYDRLQELGNALDHAEATDPALRPRDRGRGFAVRRRAPWERLGSNNVWIVPQHSAVRAYWRELKADIGRHVYVECDLRTCRQNYKRAWNAYDDLTIARDSGAFLERPSLRTILDARAVVVESFIILEQVEASATAIRRMKAAENDRALRRHNPELHTRLRTRKRRRSFTPPPDMGEAPEG